MRMFSVWSGGPDARCTWEPCEPTLSIFELAARQGVEPRLPGSEPSVLPLNERAKWSGAGDLNSHQLASKARVLPLHQPPIDMVGTVGLEPTLAGFRRRRAIRYSTSQWGERRVPPPLDKRFTTSGLAICLRSPSNGSRPVTRTLIFGL